MCFKNLYNSDIKAEFTLYGDNSFYSLREKVPNYTYSNLVNYKDPINDISEKTGLGSSAAMITSFTSAWYLLDLYQKTKDIGVF